MRVDTHAMVSLLRSKNNMWESFQYIGPRGGIYSPGLALSVSCYPEPSKWPLMWNLEEVLGVCSRPAQPVLSAQTTVVGPPANASIFPTEVTRRPSLTSRTCWCSPGAGVWG